MAHWWDVLVSNPYFSAGVGLYGVAAAGIVSRMGARHGRQFALRRLRCSIDVTNRDPSFQWIMDWMAKRNSDQYQSMTVQSTEIIQCNERVRTQFQFTPSPGTHWITYQGRWVWLTRRRHMEKGVGTDVLETLELVTIGGEGAKKVLYELIEEAMQTATQGQSDKIALYYPSGTQWTRFHQLRTRRPMESVILDSGDKHEIVGDVKRFLRSATDYTKLGIPYRRGYLLYGPPGCGKSSFIFALAGEVDMAICMISLSNRQLSDEALSHLVNTAPQPSIILIEDVDHAFLPQVSRVTLSGLLNAIDGVGAQEGRLLFMTTNHFQQLDPALIRPGRVDMVKHLGLASAGQVRDMFLRFMPGEARRAEEFARLLPELSVSPARLQGYLFLRREAPERAITEIAELLAPSLQQKQQQQQQQQQQHRQQVLPPHLIGNLKS